jgi:protein-tyrosine phosphatase
MSFALETSIDAERDIRIFGNSDAPWLVGARSAAALRDADVDGRSAWTFSLVVDLDSGDAVIDDAVIDDAAAQASATAAMSYRLEKLTLTQGHELTAAVAAIAAAEGPVLVLCTAGGKSKLVLVLALPAAGAPADSVLEACSWMNRPGDEGTDDADETLRGTLRVLDGFNGVECYLLHHGLSVEEFHLLREKFQELHDEP